MRQQTTTLLDLKVQASASAQRFSDFMLKKFVPATKDSGTAVTVAKILKKSGRILQKWWLRGEVVRGATRFVCAMSDSMRAAVMRASTDCGSSCQAVHDKISFMFNCFHAVCKFVHYGIAI